MHRIICNAILVALLTASIALGKPAPSRGSAVLVVSDLDVSSSFSGLLSHLDSFGRVVTTAQTSDKSISVQADGAYLYDAIILLFSGAVGLDVKLPVQTVANFIDSGRDVFIATGAERSSYANRIAELLGIDTDEAGNILVDHQNTLSDSWVRVGGMSGSQALFGPDLAKQAAAGRSEVGFRGAGATLFRDNELVVPLMWGSGSTLGRPAGKARGSPKRVPRVAGAGAVLSAGVSAWSGGRAGWIGSVEALTDAATKTLGNGHEMAMRRLVGWTLGESGVLRVARVAHGLVSEGGAGEMDGPSEYRVKDVVEFVMELQMWDGEKGEWVGWETDDLQVEFVMLNPWVRTRMHAVAGRSGVYSAKVQVPDQIGVYKFKVEYVRAGLTPVRVEKVVPVRPFLHNEYERFIGMAAPYYVGSLSMMVGVFFLAVVLLSGDVERGWEKVTKTE